MLKWRFIKKITLSSKINFMLVFKGVIVLVVVCVLLVSLCIEQIWLVISAENNTIRGVFRILLTSMRKFFGENIQQRLKTVHYFLKESAMIDIWYRPKYVHVSHTTKKFLIIVSFLNFTSIYMEVTSHFPNSISA